MLERPRLTMRRSKSLSSIDNNLCSDSDWPFKDNAMGADILRLIPGPIKSDTVALTARYYCDVSSQL